MNNSIPYQVPMMGNPYHTPSNADNISTSWLSILTPIILNTLSQIVSQITLTRVIILILVLGNIKNVPFIWHLRIVNAFRFCCRTQRPKVPLTSDHIFQPIVTTSYAPLMEIDFNLHKTNSSYFSDIDIARTHLVCTLFSTGIENQRGGTSGYNRGGRPLFGLALGAVSCSFKKELKPYEKYEMWTRVLSWDEKWIYIVTHFVKTGKGKVTPRKGYSLYPQQNGPEEVVEMEAEGKGKRMGEEMDDPIRRLSERSDSDFLSSTHPSVVATALSKCVFKSGRRTVSPALMLKLSGLLPVASLDETIPDLSASRSLSSSSLSSSSNTSDTTTSPHLPSIPETPEQPYIPSSTSSDSGIDMHDSDNDSNADEPDLKMTPRERILRDIERERSRGMQVAKGLAASAQRELEEEFMRADEALGRHSDGTGVGGVVSTLWELAGLGRSVL